MLDIRAVQNKICDTDRTSAAVNDRFKRQGLFPATKEQLLPGEPFIGIRGRRRVTWLIAG